MSNLVDYATEELNRAGLLDTASDYDGMLGEAVLDLVKAFSKQGHSGASAATTVSLLERLLRYEPLTPLTFARDEWIDQSYASGTSLWQNKRDSRIFTEDEASTYYSVDDNPRVYRPCADQEPSDV